MNEKEIWVYLVSMIFGFKISDFFKLLQIFSLTLSFIKVYLSVSYYHKIISIRINLKFHERMDYKGS